MAKSSGGTRILKSGSREYQKRENEVVAMKESGLYSSVEFFPSGGGWVAIEKSRVKHKEEELEAASLLAQKGYKVTLTDEGGFEKVVDGKLFIDTYEQKTPLGDTATNITTALRHARDKKADVAVIYMKHDKHTRKTVEDGIIQYENNSSYRFNKIIVITKDGRLHIHKHNK